MTPSEAITLFLDDCRARHLAAATWSVVAAILIFANLQQRGEAGNFLFLRLFLPKYVSQYRSQTLAETGRTGPLFFHFVIPINLALVFAVALVVVSAA